MTAESLILAGIACLVQIDNVLCIHKLVDSGLVDVVSFATPSNVTADLLSLPALDGAAEFKQGFQLYGRAAQYYGRQYFLQSAQKHYPPAFLYLATIHEKGLGLTIDATTFARYQAEAQRHEAWFHEQAKTGSAISQFLLGRYYSTIVNHTLARSRCASRCQEGCGVVHKGRKPRTFRRSSSPWQLLLLCGRFNSRLQGGCGVGPEGG